MESLHYDYLGARAPQRRLEKDGGESGRVLVDKGEGGQGAQGRKAKVKSGWVGVRVSGVEKGVKAGGG